MGAISSVNLLKNDIGVEQAQALVIILKEHLTLKTLCGNNGNETELNMSGKMRGPGDAIMLVPDVIDNRALTSLDISDNKLAQGAYKGRGVIYETHIYATDTTAPQVCASALLHKSSLMQ
jgi:hypothetical protein